MRFNLREKLLVPVVAAVAAGMIAGFLSIYLASTRSMEASIRASLVREARNTADLIDVWMEARHTDLKTWSLTPVFAEALVESGFYGKSAINGANELLETLENGYPYYDFIFIADAQGYLISTSHRSSPRQFVIRDREYFKRAIQGTPWTSEVIVSRESGKKVFVVSVPLRQGDSIVGILAGAVNLSDFSNIFIHDFKLEQKGFAYIADPSGEVLAMSKNSPDLSDLGDFEAGQHILTTGEGSLVFRFRGRQVITAYDTLEQTGWIFAMTQSLDQAFGPVRQIGWYSLAAGCVLLVIVGAVVTAIFRQVVTTRFGRMLSAISRVEQGDLGVRISGQDADDEIGDLTKAFNHMTARLETTLSELRHEIRVREQTEQDLARHRDTLELRVVERTSELAALRNYLADVVNSMPSIMVGVNHEMKINQWNLKAAQFTGVPENLAMGSSFQRQFPHLDAMVPEMVRAIREKKIFYRAKVFRHGEPGGCDDITVYPLMAEGMTGAVIRMDDTTEQAALESIMIQSEKMMSIGGLAAGMAHEINNPLAGIIQNLQVMKNRLSPDLPKNLEAAQGSGVDLASVREYMSRRGMFKLMDAALGAGARAAQIVDNMLLFSRNEAPDMSSLVLQDIMDQAIDLAHSDYGLKTRCNFKGIRILREYPDPPLSIYGHPGMLQQVFFNLLKNGAQAMAGDDSCVSPQFTIAIRAMGNDAEVRIQDNGPGMDKETRRRIFEPFFTTNEIGKGTGLGLFVSYFIVADHHGGRIEAVSEPGDGTCFVIRLPLEGAVHGPGVKK